MCERTLRNRLTRKQWRVATTIAAYPHYTRAQVAAELGVSRTAVSDMVQRINARLRACGLLPIGTRLA